MKTTLALTLLSFIHLCFTYPFKGNDKPPYLSKNFTVTDNGSLIVKTSGGSVTVVGGPGNEVKVEMYVKKGASWFGSDDDTKEALKDFTITIKKEGNSIIAKAEREGSSGWFSSNNTSISFKVYTPTKINCELKTSGGSINLSKVIGSQMVNTSGGNLVLNSIRGNLVGHTSGGSINVKNYKGDLDAHTSGGSIEIFEAKGVLKAHTSGGGIELREIYGSIEASTSGGSIEADIKEAGKFIDLHTSGGSINATVPSGKGFNLELSGNSVNTKLNNFSGESKRDKVVGKINGGGIPVKLSTSGGSVNLNYSM